MEKQKHLFLWQKDAAGLFVENRNHGLAWSQSGNLTKQFIHCKAYSKAIIEEGNTRSSQKIRIYRKKPS